jgi:signal transduction histidine kinase
MATMANDSQKLRLELYEENKRLKSLLELGQVLADPQEPLDGKLTRCVQLLARLTQAESCSLMLVENGELVVRAANCPGLVGLAAPLDQASIATDVVKSGQAIYAKQVAESGFAEIRRHNGKRTYRTGSLISLPLWDGGEVVGVLNLADKAGESYFSEQDAETAQGIAGEISRLVNFSALHARLETAYQDLAEAQQTKDDLMHMIFHDMKAPVTAAKEMLSFLDSSGELEPHEKSHCLALAQSDLEILWRRISNLLDLKRLEAGQYPLNPISINLADLARETVNRLFHLTKSHELELVFKVKAEPWVVADEDLLERILTNLLLNAAKYSGMGGESGRVALSVGINAGRARVEISDNGPGVDPVLGEAIFDRYVSGAAGQDSTGLGLYFCRRAAGLLGGEVGFFNQPHHGTVFYLELPLENEA